MSLHSVSTWLKKNPLKNEQFTENPPTSRPEKTNLSYIKSVMSFLRKNQTCEPDERIFKHEVLGCFVAADLRLNTRASN